MENMAICIILAQQFVQKTMLKCRTQCHKQKTVTLRGTEAAWTWDVCCLNRARLWRGSIMDHPSKVHMRLLLSTESVGCYKGLLPLAARSFHCNLLSARHSSHTRLTSNLRAPPAKRDTTPQRQCLNSTSHQLAYKDITGIWCRMHEDNLTMHTKGEKK